MVLNWKYKRSRLLYEWENIFFKLSTTNSANMPLFKMNSGNTSAMCEICLKLIKTPQNQPSRGVLRKKCSESMQQIYRRKLMPKCDFNKVPLQCF